MTNMTHPDIKPSKIQFEPSSCSTMTDMIHSEPLITKDLIDALLNRVNEKLEISLNVSDFDQYTASSGNPPGEDDLSDRKILSMAKEKAGDGNHVGSYMQRLRTLREIEMVTSSHHQASRDRSIASCPLLSASYQAFRNAALTDHSVKTVSAV